MTCFKWTVLWSMTGLLLIIAACTPQISEDQKMVKNGQVFRKGDHEPFSGYVVGNDRSRYGMPNRTYRLKYENGRLNGNAKFWYENGQLESIVPYKDGKVNGVVTEYYANGQIKARIHIVDGLRGGYKGEMFWDENGHRIKG